MSKGEEGRRRQRLCLLVSRSLVVVFLPSGWRAGGRLDRPKGLGGAHARARALAAVALCGGHGVCRTVDAEREGKILVSLRHPLSSLRPSLWSWSPLHRPFGSLLRPTALGELVNAGRGGSRRNRRVREQQPRRQRTDPEKKTDMGRSRSDWKSVIRVEGDDRRG